MANAEQLRQLNSGSVAWNGWRLKNAGVVVDLQGADLSGFVLLKVNLSNANLRGADLSDSDLRGADLHGADLRGANLRNAVLTNGIVTKKYQPPKTATAATFKRLAAVALNLTASDSTTLIDAANLSGADLRGAYLSKADLQDADLTQACMDEAYLHGANLSSACMNEVSLKRAELKEANLRDTDLHKANLEDADCSKADMRKADLSGAYMRRTSFRETDCSEVNLRNANLTGADCHKAWMVRADLRDAIAFGANLDESFLNKSDLENADFSRSSMRAANLSEANLRSAVFRRTCLAAANLSATQSIGADFAGAVLTEACLENWSVNSTTKFDGAQCEYVYLKADMQERRPREGGFKPGEFSTLFQQVLGTVDLIFQNGIDWQAFSQTFQSIQTQYVDQNISVQAIEKKAGGSFVVRLAVPETIDKAAVEQCAKAEYSVALQSLEARYEAQLMLQGKHLEDARHTIEVERQEKATMLGVITSMASQQGPKFDLRGAQFAGGMAETVQGDQVGGTINNYGAKLEDIAQILSTLREQAQTFPDEYREDALDTINDLEVDLEKASPDQNKIKRQLKRLVATASAVAAIAGGAATFSGDIKDFTGNVVELTEVLELPIELIQPAEPQLTDK